jgi:hypothetical protein
MNHPEEITKTTPNYIIKWVLKQRQPPLPFSFFTYLSIITQAKNNFLSYLTFLYWSKEVSSGCPHLLLCVTS